VISLCVAHADCLSAQLMIAEKMAVKNFVVSFSLPKMLLVSIMSVFLGKRYLFPL